MAQELLGFWEQRQKAAESYVNGDFRSLKEMLPHSGEATLHSPRGDRVVRIQEAARHYKQDTKSFRPGSRTDLEVPQSAEADGWKLVHRHADMPPGAQA